MKKTISLILCFAILLSTVAFSIPAVAVEMDFGVEASEETVKDGSYVIQRPFVLVTKKDTKLSDEAQEFFDWVTSSDAAETIASAGVVAVN